MPSRAACALCATSPQNLCALFGQRERVDDEKGASCRCVAIECASSRHCAEEAGKEEMRTICAFFAKGGRWIVGRKEVERNGDCLRLTLILVSMVGTKAKRV